MRNPDLFKKKLHSHAMSFFLLRIDSPKYSPLWRSGLTNNIICVRWQVEIKYDNKYVGTSEKWYSLCKRGGNSLQELATQTHNVDNASVG